MNKKDNCIKARDDFSQILKTPTSLQGATSDYCDDVIEKIRSIALAKPSYCTSFAKRIADHIQGITKEEFKIQKDEESCLP